MPQFNLETWPSQIFWLLISFLALYFILSRVVSPRLRNVADQRSQFLSSQQQEVVKSQQLAQDALNQRQKTLNNAHSDASQLLKNAADLASKNAAQLLKNADSQRSSLLQQNDQRLRSFVENSQPQLLDAAALVAAQLAKTLANVNVNKNDAVKITKNLAQSS